MADYHYDGAQPHAVTSVDREQPDGTTATDSYVYDNNGNMTCRHEGGQVWVHSYNAENRISKIEKMDGDDCVDQGTATESWTYTYDGDGVRVMEVYAISSVDQTTKHFFTGGAYEVEINHIPDPDTTTTKKYYSIAGMRVAMDDGANLTYFASDHLSSTSISLDASGTLLSEQRYKPFGELRTDVGLLLSAGDIGFTDFGYTGQRDLGDVKLMDYNARFYSPLLGRFIQPDTIVPGAGNPQSFNRYSYVLNSPLIYSDPSGHRILEAPRDVLSDWTGWNLRMLKSEDRKYNPWATFGGSEWTNAEQAAVTNSVRDVGIALAEVLNEIEDSLLAGKWGKILGTSYTADYMNAVEAIEFVFGGKIPFVKHDNDPGWAGFVENGKINLYSTKHSASGELWWMHYQYTIVHEIGHLFDGGNIRGKVTDDWLRPTFLNDAAGALRIDHGNAANYWHGYAGNWEFQSGYIFPSRSGEEFADMFVGWIYGFNTNPNSLGPQRAVFTQSIIVDYLTP